MEFVKLRRAGGSLTLTIPKGFARELALSAGDQVGVSVSDGKLVAQPAVRQPPRYTLDDLLSQCDPRAPLSAEDRAWLADEAHGSELI
jgi:antitoxin ChpS